MKTKVAILLVGLLLGSAGTSLATSQSWQRQGAHYRCEGTSYAVRCYRNSSPWNVVVYSSGVAVFRGRLPRTATLVFRCSVLATPDECIDSR